MIVDSSSVPAMRSFASVIHSLVLKHLGIEAIAQMRSTRCGSTGASKVSESPPCRTMAFVRDCMVLRLIFGEHTRVYPFYYTHL